MASQRPAKERGRIETIELSKVITFNGNKITRAIIEIDHINHGLNDDKTGLKDSKRTNFSLKDIEKFIYLLDGEHLAAEDYKGKLSQFSIRINCPVKGRFYGKMFYMIFDTHYDRASEIHTITLYPGW